MIVVIIFIIYSIEIICLRDSKKTHTYFCLSQKFESWNITKEKQLKIQTFDGYKEKQSSICHFLEQKWFWKYAAFKIYT